QQARARSRPGGDDTTNTGTPVRAARSRPAGSVRIAIAPAATAWSQKAAPCVCAPGSAAYRSPGRTCRESSVTPESRPGPFGILSVLPTPSSSASPDNGRGGTCAGRITPRGYPKSARIEPDIWRFEARLWRNPQGLQRELHHAIEHRARDFDPEVGDLLVRILHVRRDDDLRAVARRHPDEARPVLAQRALGTGLLGGAGLGRDRVAGDDAPRLVAREVPPGHLLQDLDQIVRRLRLDHPPGWRRLRRR